MLVYIIDGFNVIHKIEEIKKSPSPHREFITYLRNNSLTGSRRNKVVIVFDGFMKQDFREYQYKIIFSGKTTADEIIKKKVREEKNKSEIRVVSDDREIINYARREGAKTVSVRDFLSKKRKRKIESSFSDKEISSSLKEEITNQLRKIWLKE